VSTLPSGRTRGGIFWSFLGLTIITLGVYPYYFIATRLEEIHEMLSRGQK